MDILSCPGALLALNDLTILFNPPTVTGCNEMDSERALLKKSLGDEFVEGILLAKFGRILVNKSQNLLAMSVGLLIFISFLVKLAGYGDLATRLLITSLRIFHVSMFLCQDCTYRHDYFLSPCSFAAPFPRQLQTEILES